MSSLTADWQEEHTSDRNLLNAGVLAASSNELALHRLPASTGLMAGVLDDARPGAAGAEDDRHRQYGVELSKRMKSQGIHQAVKDLSAEAEADIDPTLTIEVSSRSRSTSKRRKSSVSSVLKQIGKASKKRSSKRKEAAASGGGGSSPAPFTPKLEEKKGDTAKGSQRGRSSRSSFFAKRENTERGDDSDDDVQLWGSGHMDDASFDVIDRPNNNESGNHEKKKKVRSSSAGIVGRMRLRRKTMAERKHGRRASRSPTRARRPSTRKQQSAFLQDAMVMSKSSSGTSGDDNATAVVDNKGVGGLGSSHLKSIVAEAQAAREKLVMAHEMERRLVRESSGFFADRSERTKSTLMMDRSERTRSTLNTDRSERTRSTLNTDRSERTRSTHTMNSSFSDLRQHNNLVVEVPTRNMNRDRVQPVAQLSSSDHAANSYSDLASASVRVARTLLRHSHPGESSPKEDDFPSEKDALHTSDSQFDYTPSPTPKKKAVRTRSRGDRNKQMKFGMDGSGGTVTRKREKRGERATLAAPSLTASSSIKQSPRVTRRTKGMSASDRTDSVRTRSTLVTNSRNRASALAAAVSASAHVRSTPPETTVKVAENHTKSMREARSTGIRSGEPMFSINGAVVPRVHDHALQTLKARGMSASERVHSTRRESFSKSKGMGGSSRMGGSGRMNDTSARLKKMVVSGALEKPRLVASKSADSYVRQLSWRRGTDAAKEWEEALRTSATIVKGERSSRDRAHARVKTPPKKTKRLSMKGGKSVEPEITRRSPVPPAKSTGKNGPPESTSGAKKPRESTSKSRHSRRTRRSTDETRNKKRSERQHRQTSEGTDQGRSRSHHPRLLQPNMEDGSFDAKAGKTSSKAHIQRPSSVPPGGRLAGVKSITVQNDEKMPGLVNLDRADLTSLDPSQVLSILAAQQAPVVPDNAKTKYDEQNAPTNRAYKSHHMRSTTANKQQAGGNLLKSSSERQMKRSVEDGDKFERDFFSEHERHSASSWGDAADGDDEFGLL